MSEVRHLVALAVHDAQFRFFVERTAEPHKPPALPTWQVSEALFARLSGSHEVCSTMNGLLVDNSNPSLIPEWAGSPSVATARRHQGGRTTYIALVIAECSHGTAASGFLNIESIIRDCDGRLDLPLSLLVQEERKRGRARLGPDMFLEYDKDGAEFRPEVCTPEQLWLDALPNYRLFASGEANSAAASLRQSMVLSAAKTFLQAHLSQGLNYVDVGCGPGDLVRLGRQLGANAIGVDIGHGGSATEDFPLIVGTVNDIDKLLPAASQNVLTLINVLQWVENLDEALSACARVMRPGGRIGVLQPANEFHKIGDWHHHGGAHEYLISRPLRREPHLAMIGYAVGPLWFFPRDTPTYLTAMSRHRLFHVSSHHIYADTYSRGEASIPPAHAHYQMLPLFLMIEAVYLPAANGLGT